MNKIDALHQLKAEIELNTQGSDLAATATQLVMGEGNVDANVVFIGEAPGKKEDETGRPFVGASGRFLNEMLESVGMNRDNVYITNIVKYRPPDNREPTKDEKRRYLPYLMRQLEIIQPKIIMTLGRHSGMNFIPDLVISRDHGNAQTISIDGRELVIIPLYHPAAALYNGSMRQVLLDDFAAAVQQAH
jgi:uracil-DNA glycosylase